MVNSTEMGSELHAKMEVPLQAWSVAILFHVVRKSRPFLAVTHSPVLLCWK